MKTETDSRELSWRAYVGLIMETLHALEGLALAQGFRGCSPEDVRLGKKLRTSLGLDEDGEDVAKALKMYREVIGGRKS